MTIKCPKCGSTNWRCWDERYEWFEITEDEHPERIGELIQLPVGYLACKDCQTAWVDYDESDGCKHVGDDVDAFGRNEGWDIVS